MKHNAATAIEYFDKMAPKTHSLFLIYMPTKLKPLFSSLHLIFKFVYTECLLFRLVNKPGCAICIKIAGQS